MKQDLSKFVFVSLVASLMIGVSVVPVPVMAADTSTAKDAGDPSVQLASVGIPVFNGRQVVNYLFLSIRLSLTPKANQEKLRDMEPYFRDALVHAASKTSFNLAGHFDQLDEPRFKSAMMIEFSKITGPGMIKSVDILSQSPKTRPN